MDNSPVFCTTPFSSLALLELLLFLCFGGIHGILGKFSPGIGPGVVVVVGIVVVVTVVVSVGSASNDSWIQKTKLLITI